MKILMVENHKEFAEIVIEQFLNDNDVEVIPTIADAKILFEKNKFDVVLVDYDLDDGKGEALVRFIRKKGLDMPIIGISAFEEKNKLLFKTGADTFCPKTKFDKILFIFEELGL